jgi:hypothetical protein
MMHSSVCASDVRFVRPMFTGRVAQVPGEVSTTTKDGCPRCLAFGHLGDQEPQQAGSALSRHL